MVCCTAHFSTPFLLSSVRVDAYLVWGFMPA